MRLRAPKPIYAAGMPATDVVSACLQGGRGDKNRHNSVVLLTNGTNTFAVNPWPYKHISVEPAEGGVFNIVGKACLDGGDDKDILARFGSESGAANGFHALLRAHSGLRAPGAASPALTMVKWAGGLAALFVGVVLLGAFANSPEQVASAGPGASVAVASAGMPSAAQGASRFDPNEPTLEELAAGGYQFNPKLQVPEITAPALNCAPK